MYPFRVPAGKTFTHFSDEIFWRAEQIENSWVPAGTFDTRRRTVLAGQTSPDGVGLFIYILINHDPHSSPFTNRTFISSNAAGSRRCAGLSHFWSILTSRNWLILNASRRHNGIASSPAKSIFKHVVIDFGPSNRGVEKVSNCQHCTASAVLLIYDRAERSSIYFPLIEDCLFYLFALVAPQLHYFSWLFLRIEVWFDGDLGEKLK